MHRFRLDLAERPATGTAWDSSAARCSLGSGDGNDPVIAAPTVSRSHCEILIDDARARVSRTDSIGTSTTSTPRSYGDRST
ncbi:FHA domain-containing protein [Sorangium cellulosum]|uniref:FHA domain-containing protein n=1 Tax=Sorangium cellulosum TaxID=56 RepID=UPI0026B6D8BD